MPLCSFFPPSRPPPQHTREKPHCSSHLCLSHSSLWSAFLLVHFHFLSQNKPSGEVTNQVQISCCTQCMLGGLLPYLQHVLPWHLCGCSFDCRKKTRSSTYVSKRCVHIHYTNGKKTLLQQTSTWQVIQEWKRSSIDQEMRYRQLERCTGYLNNNSEELGPHVSPPYIEMQGAAKGKHFQICMTAGDDVRKGKRCPKMQRHMWNINIFSMEGLLNVNLYFSWAHYTALRPLSHLDLQQVYSFNLNSHKKINLQVGNQAFLHIKYGNICPCIHRSVLNFAERLLSLNSVPNV